MRKVYWRPTRILWQIHLLLAVVAITALFAVEKFKVQVKQPYYKEKLAASKTMKRGMEVLKEYRLKYVAPIDPETDPLDSGMIGALSSPIISDSGVLSAKQATINPNWAAAMVEMLKKADVQEGDVVAAGFSGSFPALNLATLAAIEALKAKPVIIVSAAASTWGANLPMLTWPDMEAVLNNTSIISSHSVAASLGGTKDRALGMSRRGKELLKQAIERNKLEFISKKNEKENIDIRMAIYRENAEGKTIKAYVNVGGGTISVGTRIGKRLFRSGYNRKVSTKALMIDSVMSRFARDGVPVIHMSGIRKIAEKFHMPYEITETMPRPGAGALFSFYEYNMTLVVVMLFLLIALLIFFIKTSAGQRIFTSTKSSSRKDRPEPMV